MNKKMIKRSLALGALMAFVITGSAMAAELETKKDIVSAIDGLNQTYTLKPDVDTKTVNLEGTSAKNNTLIKNADIDLSDGQTLNLVSVDNSGSLMGVIKDVNIDSGYGNVVIKQNGNSNAALGYDSVTNIHAKSITIESEYSYAIYTGGFDGDSTTLKADTITLTSGDNAVFAQAGGKINITANDKLTINAVDKAVTSLGKGSEIYIASADKESKADIVINGHVRTVGDGAKLTIALETANSVLNGKVYNNPDTTNSDKTLILSNNAKWNNNGESDVEKVILNGGIIDQTDENAGKITVNELSGSGTLNVNSTEEDQLVVKNAKEANLTVSTTSQDIQLKDLAGVATTADGKESAAKKVMKKLDDGVHSDEWAEVEGLNKVGATQYTVDAGNISANDMMAVGLMSWRAETNDMNKRMGELRNANGEHGVWVRMVRGEQEYKGVKNQYNQYQLGYDEKLSVDKRWTVGAALSYTDASNSFSNGNGESTNKALAVYGSKLNNDGSFVDLIAKYGRLENDFKLYTGMEDADYSTNAYSLSAEFGKRIQQGGGVWVEPQVELTYGKVSAVDFVSKKGVKVAQDSMESLIGRVGFSLGKDIKQGNVYARASYLYDFDGETSSTLTSTTSTKLEQDLGGGWWEVGVGANINLSDVTYIYADVEKTFGGEVDTNWQWNLGVRYSF